MTHRRPPLASRSVDTIRAVRTPGTGRAGHRRRLAAAALLPLLLGAAPSAFSGERLALNFRGTGTAEPRQVPDTLGIGSGGMLDANCFSADVYDLASGRRLGTVEDCLTEVSMGSAAPSGSGVQVVGTTIFELERGWLTGRLVIQGMTSVQPVNWPTENGDVTFTHVTGANASMNAVVDGDGGFANTGDFAGRSATVRLSGQVDLSKASQGEITFDCVFVVDVLDAEEGDGDGATGQRYDSTQGEVFWNRQGYVTFSIYRDGVLQKTREGNSHYQSNLVDGVSYAYEVRAVTEDGGEKLIGDVVLPGSAGPGR